MYISWPSDFALYLEDYLMYDWPKNKCSSLWLISWSNGWRLFDVWTSYLGIMGQYDPTFDIKINVCHCDLHFMVWWFCTIYWRLFDMNISIWDCESVWHEVCPQNKIVGHCDVYFMVQWFCHELETIWCMNIILWDYGSVWPNVRPQNKCRSLWLILHGPVILSFISIVPFLLNLGSKFGPIPNAKKYLFFPNWWPKIPNWKILKNYN